MIVFRYVTSPDVLCQVTTAVGQSAMVGLDSETTSLDPRSGRLRLLSLASEHGTWLVDCFAVDPRPLWPALAARPLIAHNAAFDLAFLDGVGFSPGPVRDTMLLSRIIYAGGGERHGLQACAERELGRTLSKELQASDWSAALSLDQLEYAAADAEVLLPLYQALEAKAKAAELIHAADIEHRCTPALVWLARSGVGFDPARWEALAREAAQESERLAQELDQAAPAPSQMLLFGGGGWNWDSPQQIQKALRAAGCRLDDTDDATLARLDHPLAELLRRYRVARKRCTTYGRDWLQYVHRDSRVYASWHQLGASSGRMACSTPNLQNLPRGDYRRCFVAPPGRRLVKADYSQIELRIAARVSGDAAMLRAYREGADLHELTARQVLGVPDVNREERQLAKALNFGLLYGMGAQGFQRYAKAKYALDLPLERAEAYRGAFFRAYPGLADWHRRVKRERAAETRTLAGRRCRIGAESFDSMRLNTPVQGTGADGLKRALALLWERREQLPGAFPVLAVHDEIVLECDEQQGPAASAWLKQAMVDSMADWLDPVPVEVSVKVESTWGGEPAGAP